MINVVYVGENQGANDNNPKLNLGASTPFSIKSCRCPNPKKCPGVKQCQNIVPGVALVRGTTKGEVQVAAPKGTSVADMRAMVKVFESAKACTGCNFCTDGNTGKKR